MQSNTATEHPWEAQGLGRAPYTLVGHERRTYQACPEAPVQVGGSCDACGTGIVDHFYIRAACGATFKVGCECVRKVNPRGTPVREAVERARLANARERRAAAREERAAKREAAYAAERTARVERAKAANLEAFPGLAEALACTHPIVADIRARFEQGWSLSSAQVALVLKLAREAAAPPEVHCPAPEGKVTFEGEIVSTKVQESRYGTTTTKLVVKVATPEGTWLAWVTRPAALGRTTDAQGFETYLPNAELRGRKVRLTATLERSDRDAHFAFAKRPVGTLI